jgi:hypothetical protein
MEFSNVQDHKALEALIAAGADLHAKMGADSFFANEGQTALHINCGAKLRQHSMRPPTRSGQLSRQESTPISGSGKAGSGLRSEYDGKADSVKILLGHNCKADPHLKRDDGGTALLWACYEYNRDIIKLLVDAKVDPNATPVKGDLPVAIAQRSP